MFPSSSRTEEDDIGDDVGSRWQRHARAAIRHVDRVVATARDRVENAPGSRESRLHARERLGELIRRQEHLAELHRQIEGAQGGDHERLWQRFFLQYDDFIQTLSDTRIDLRHASRRHATDRADRPSER